MQTYCDMNMKRMSITLDDEVIIGNKFVKRLGVKIVNKLDFNEHVSSSYKKVSIKLQAP